MPVARAISAIEVFSNPYWLNCVKAAVIISVRLELSVSMGIINMFDILTILT